MRFINTYTLKLHEFVDARKAPPYAILSHSWREDEVSFKDYMKGRKHGGAGCKKIIDCCAFALSRGMNWAWVDTCCIDKRSSAELSEAINSMFKWYQCADECYAHLYDVTATTSDTEDLIQQCRKSRWFTRGWTLQELIAPELVIFVDADWMVIGGKSIPRARELIDCNGSEAWLTETIGGITGIPVKILWGSGGDQFESSRLPSALAGSHTERLLGKKIWRIAC